MTATAEQIAEAKEHFRIDTEITVAEVKHIPRGEDADMINTANMFLGGIKTLESFSNGNQVILVWTESDDSIEVVDPEGILVDGMPPKNTPVEEGGTE